MRHVNIPIFIPHLGCPNQCVFCNQRSISGVNEFNPDSVRNIIEQTLSTVNSDDIVEIAFFGGSFTGIDRDLMVHLLEIGYSYIRSGRVKSIRCSTRPDYISDEILDILEKYGVKTIELGLQSSSDEVLKSTKRGHNFEAEQQGCRLIVERGFNLIGQMMIGLPSSNLEKEIETAEFIIRCGASGARIYPTVVFRETELCQLAEQGYYAPLDIDDAIKRSAAVFEKFVDAGVDVIRIGLQASDNLLDQNCYYAGPNHPSLGEYVIGEFYYNKIVKLLNEQHCIDRDRLIINVAKGKLSQVIGQNKRNKIRLTEKYKKIRFVENENLSGYEILVET